MDDAAAPWSAAVTGVATRVLGRLPGRLTLLSMPGGGRRFRYAASEGELRIAATDPLSACVGLHRYLRRAAGLAVHWDTRLPLDLDAFPDAPATEGTARVSEQYMYNFCTFSYTMAHWSWAEWEREIDWLALHGVTMPLIATGHEAVLLDAYTGLGLPEDEALEFIGADAYVAFTLMGNLDSAVGPRTRAAIEDRAALGARILDRTRQLGMTPVLPAFTGNVPRALFPGRVSPREWQGFTTHVLDPGDPAFGATATAIARAQIGRFGTDHLYASDPFIEMIPVEDDPEYPARVARTILDALIAADPDARWVLQSWPFSYQADFWSPDRVRTFLEAVPRDRLLLLDLWAEEDPQWDGLAGFFGTEWVWCALLNFGGRGDPVGDLQRTVAEAERALAAPHPPSGIGLTMEATRNNPVFFELVADLAWEAVDDLESWLERFARERYGADLPGARTAWTALLETVYGSSGRRVFPEDFLGTLTRRPTTVLAHGLERLRADVRSLVWFEPRRLLDAMEALLGILEREPARADGPVGHDLVDVSIAVFSRLVDALVVRSANGDPASASRLVEAIDALDGLLSTRREYALSTWLGDPDLRDATSDRASRQILTSWGGETRGPLDDYSARIWHGLVGPYYRARWSAWASGDPGDLEDRLDRIWARFLAEGGTEEPRASSELPQLARAAFREFGPDYLALVERDDVSPRPHRNGDT